jgi:hypothetical protein
MPLADWQDSQVRMAELQDQVYAARACQREAERELKQFKVRAREVGISYAERYDWCSVFDDILAELGLPPRTRRWEVKFQVTGYFMTDAIEARSRDEAIEIAQNRQPFHFGSVTDFANGLPFTFEEVSAEEAYPSD